MNELEQIERELEQIKRLANEIEQMEQELEQLDRLCVVAMVVLLVVGAFAWVVL